jgi:formylmethanofuran--tetrahydromethanopterin N-formyltransferase
MQTTTNQRFVPTLKYKVEDTNIPVDVNAVYELVINDIDIDAVAAATKAGIEASVKIQGVKKILPESTAEVLDSSRSI